MPNELLWYLFSGNNVQNARKILVENKFYVISRDIFFLLFRRHRWIHLNISFIHSQTTWKKLFSFNIWKVFFFLSLCLKTDFSDLNRSKSKEIWQELSCFRQSLITWNVRNHFLNTFSAISSRIEMLNHLRQASMRECLSLCLNYWNRLEF